MHVEPVSSLFDDSTIATFRMRVDQLVYTSRRKLLRKKKGNMKMEKNTSPGASTLSLSIAGLTINIELSIRSL